MSMLRVSSNVGLYLGKARSRKLSRRETVEKLEIRRDGSGAKQDWVGGGGQKRWTGGPHK